MPFEDIDSWLAERRIEAARRAALQAAQPLIEIIGLVDPSGAGRSKMAGDAEWRFSTTLVAWRLPGGPMQRTSVRLERTADDGAYAILGPAFDPYDLVRVSVRMPPPESDGVHHALLVSLLQTVVDDDELEAFASDLQASVVVSDPQLGRLTLERQYDWFKSEIAYRAGLVDLTVPATADDRPSMLAEARSVVGALADWDARARVRIGGDLFELYNDTWRDEEADRAAISREAFDARLVLTAIGIEDEGALAFWYDADNMFTDHSIEVRGTLSNGFEEASIAG